MLSTTKIRTAIATLAATFAVAVAVAPAAHASPNDGRFEQSSEAQKQRRCDLLASLFASDLVATHVAAKSGDRAVQAEYRERAGRDFDYAKKAGCGWAQ